MLLLLLLSHFSRIRLCATPWVAAHQAPLSLGFSRQEYWSGLPFPSPMHESEKWKWSRSSRARLLVTPWTAAYQAPPSMGFSSQEYWSGVPLPSVTKKVVLVGAGRITDNGECGRKQTSKQSIEKSTNSMGINHKRFLISKIKWQTHTLSCSALIMQLWGG